MFINILNPKIFMNEYLMMVFGIIFLYYGANWLVDGSSFLAKKYGVSLLTIGLTIVAFGTSLPEFIVTIFASIQGNAEVFYGDIIGSNIFNILFVLGLAAIITPLTVQKSTVWREIPFGLLAVIVFFFISNDTMFFMDAENVLTKIDGIVLLLFFAVFLGYIYILIKEGAKHNYTKKVKVKSGKIIALLIIGGSVALFIGGKLTVNSAIAVARQLGVSELLISATLVAVGTSLPELVTSIIAIIRKEKDISLGNIIGSNIFNIFFVIGISGIISSQTVPLGINLDFLVLAISTLLLFLFMFIGTKYKLNRWKGAILLGFYALYVILIVIRG